jgi:tRNA(fMet)-specific endonuclease VapC
MRFLLDTNAVFELISDKNSYVARHARNYRPRDLGVSTIVMHELFYGAFKSRRSASELSRLDKLRFELVPFDGFDARSAGELRSILSQRGTPIGVYDILIAGQAIARKLTLITHNTREFARVPGLSIDDWHP